VPIVVGGFEPVDLLEAISMLVAQLEEGRAEVENQYSRSVDYQGNIAAQKVMREVFTVADRKWRGIGPDRRRAVSCCATNSPRTTPSAYFSWSLCTWRSRECISALVLQGLKKPIDCPHSASAARR
jgi:hydrogenase expression/formation protein HypD